MRRKAAGRLLALACCALMTAASCAAVFAAGETITIKECDDLQLTLPENMQAVTRSSEPTDPYFAQHKLDYEAVQQAFRDGDSYMQAMDDKDTVTVTLSYLDTDAQDFNEMTEEQLYELTRGFLGGTDPELQYSDCTADQLQSGLTWLNLSMSVADPENGSTNQYQATTVFSGKNITLTLCRNGGDVVSEDYAVLQSIVNSVKANRVFSFRRILPYLLIAGGVILAIVLVIVIVKLVKKGKTPVKSGDDRDADKAIEDLAGKHALRTKPVVIEPAPEPEPEPEKEAAPSEEPAKTDAAPAQDKAPVIGEGQRRIIRKDFSAAKEDASADKPEPEKAAAPAEEPAAKPPVIKKKQFVDIYANSPESQKAEEKQPAAETEKNEAQPAPVEKSAPVEKPAPEEKSAPESGEGELDYSRYLDDDFDDDYDGETVVRKYSDEDIERLLAD